MVSPTVDDRIATAMSKRREGYNCSQCIVYAFADLLGEATDQVAATAAAFGGGFAGTGGLCGVMSGLGVVSSLLFWNTPADKGSLYTTVRLDAEAFKSLHSTDICRELKQKGVGCPQLIAEGIRLYCLNHNL